MDCFTPTQNNQSNNNTLSPSISTLYPIQTKILTPFPTIKCNGNNSNKNEIIEPTFPYNNYSIQIIDTSK